MTLARTKKLKKKIKRFERLSAKSTFCNITNECPVLTKESLEEAMKTIRYNLNEKGKRVRHMSDYMPMIKYTLS